MGAYRPRQGLYKETGGPPRPDGSYLSSKGCHNRSTISRFYVLSLAYDIIMKDVCQGIHRSLAANFRYALVWGKSSKFAPHAQKVGLSHVVADDDVVSSEFLFNLRATIYGRER